MEYKNNTNEGIRVPVQQGGLKPVGYVKFYPGDVKEVPDSAKNAAILLGLEEAPVVKEVKKEVKALKSSIKKKVVETKQIEAE